MSQQTLLSERQVEEEYGLSRRTSQRWRLRGEGPPARKMGASMVRYIRSELEAWIEDQPYLSPRVDSENQQEAKFAKQTGRQLGESVRAAEPSTIVNTEPSDNQSSKEGKVMNPEKDGYTRTAEPQSVLAIFHDVPPRLRSQQKGDLRQGQNSPSFGERQPRFDLERPRLSQGFVTEYLGTSITTVIRSPLGARGGRYRYVGSLARYDVAALGNDCASSGSRATRSYAAFELNPSRRPKSPYTDQTPDWSRSQIHSRSNRRGAFPWPTISIEQVILIPHTRTMSSPWTRSWKVLNPTESRSSRSFRSCLDRTRPSNYELRKRGVAQWQAISTTSIGWLKRPQS